MWYNKTMTHTQRLREAAKFLAGLVVGDFLMGAWVLSAGLLPRVIIGMPITVQGAWLWMGFDVLLFLILIHYAWHPKVMEPSVSSRTLFFAVGVITGVVAIVHFLRMVFGWQFAIGAWDAPMWMSGIAIFVAACISYMSFHFALRKK
jgi:hypothetical protein